MVTGSSGSPWDAKILMVTLLIPIATQGLAHTIPGAAGAFACTGGDDTSWYSAAAGTRFVKAIPLYICWMWFWLLRCWSPWEGGPSTLCGTLMRRLCPREPERRLSARTSMRTVFAQPGTLGFTSFSARDGLTLVGPCDGDCLHIPIHALRSNHLVHDDSISSSGGSYALADTHSDVELYVAGPS